jgi:hypothetical protein
MEQPCYKCGQMVEEGRIFCPNCRAPQIRVVLAESALAPADPSITAGGSLTSAETVPLIAIPTRWSEAAKPCALSAVISAIGIVSKLINPVIAGIGVGFLAVALYRRSNPQIAVQGKSGARIGAIAGFFCAGASGILGVIRVFLLHEAGAIRAYLLDNVHQSAAMYSDPKYKQTLDFMRSDAGLALTLVFLLVAAMIALMLLGMLGGALGGVSLGRRDRS